MCLFKLENFKVTQNYGWQVFSKGSSGKLYPCYFGPGSVPVGKWQRDKFRIRERWIYYGFSTVLKYRKGYHIFLNAKDAKEWFNSFGDYCIKKVRFKRVVARGLQDIGSLGGVTKYAKVVVCRQRFVEPD